MRPGQPEIRHDVGLEQVGAIEPAHHEGLDNPHDDQAVVVEEMVDDVQPEEPHTCGEQQGSHETHAADRRHNALAAEGELVLNRRREGFDDRN